MKIQKMKFTIYLLSLFLIIGCDIDLKKEQKQAITDAISSGKIIRDIINEQYGLEACGSGIFCKGEDGNELVCQNCTTICSGKYSTDGKLINPNDPLSKECPDIGKTIKLDGDNYVKVAGASLVGTEFAGGELRIKLNIKAWSDEIKIGDLSNKKGKGKDPDRIVTEHDFFSWDATFELKGSVTIIDNKVVKIGNFNEEGKVNSALTTVEFCKFGKGLECHDDLVNLKNFIISNEVNNVYLTWTTTLEKDNAGFHIWRSEKENGEYTRITDNLIPSKGDNSQYTFIDNNIKGGNTYYYKLEDIAFCGKSTFRYPISSSSSKVLLIKPVTDIIVSSEQVPLKFEWEKGNYSKFKFQFSDNNGQTLYEIPNEWIKGTSMTPPSTIWKNFTQERKGQTLLWRVVGENEQGQSFFSEIRHITIR